MNEKISSVSYIFLHFYRQPRSNRSCNKNSRCLETKLPRFSTFRFVTLRDWWQYVHTVVSRLIKRLSHSVQTRRAVAQFQLRTKANKSYVFVTRTFLPVPTYALLNQPRSSDSFLPSLSLFLIFPLFFSPPSVPFIFYPPRPLSNQTSLSLSPSLFPSLSPRILIPFLRTSLHENQDNATAPVGRNELQRRKEILFLRGNVQRFPEFQLPATVIIVFRSVSGLVAAILANFSFPARGTNPKDWRANIPYY